MSKIKQTLSKKIVNGLTRKRKKRMMAIGIWFFGLIAGIMLTMVFNAYLGSAMASWLAEKPEITVKVFQSNSPLQNQTYVEYVIMIQQNMQKSKSTTIENVYLVFDFDGAILSAREERIEGITNPTTRIGGGVVFVANGQVQDIHYCELLVDIEALKPGGFCSLAVIVNPTYQGNLARLHIVPNPERRYFGSFEYHALGFSFKKDVNGDIPAPRN